MATTITLQNTMDWARWFNFNRSVNVGPTNEPAITNANIVMQTILGPPFSWRWNRQNLGFIAVPNVQNYRLVNWTANEVFVLNDTVKVLIDSNGNSQRMSTGGTTGSTLPTFNNTVGGTTTDGSVIWTNDGNFFAISGASAQVTAGTNYTLGWIEKASLYVAAETKWYEMEVENNLGLDTSATRPRYISAFLESNTNDIIFRLLAPPDSAYPVYINIQSKPPLFSSSNLNQTWAPIPDDYQRIYSWGFLALFFMFSDDPRFNVANQKFVAQLLSLNEGLTETELNIFLGNWEAITGQPIDKTVRRTQGQQARGL